MHSASVVTKGAKFDSVYLIVTQDSHFSRVYFENELLYLQICVYGSNRSPLYYKEN
jgi:hypothetical protein